MALPTLLAENVKVSGFLESPASEPPKAEECSPLPSIDRPVPLSIPAILRNQGVNFRFAHLYLAERKVEEIKDEAPRKSRRNENDGKRWVRRKDNDRFAGNPHIVQAAKKDYDLHQQPTKSTFPEPLPPYLQRTTPAPSGRRPSLDVASANAGRFSLSLKGMRRDLRKAGARAEKLVNDVEGAIMDWLRQEVTLLPEETARTGHSQSGAPIGDTGVIMEVSRTPFQLIWVIEADFARYVVHCCARYHNIVSYSKDQSGTRFTYLLRPQGLTKPDALPTTVVAFQTPPATDLDYSSHGVGSDSDFVSDLASDLGDTVHVPRPLSTLSEMSGDNMIQAQPTHPPPRAIDSDWSLAGGSDVEGDLSVNEDALLQSIESLNIIDTTPRPPPRARRRISAWARGHIDRSTSSPSRSPARLPKRQAKAEQRARLRTRSFYDYLYN